MKDTQPVLDIAAEAGGSALDLILVALVVLAALAYLGRGLWRRRHGGMPRCTNCTSCGAGGTCPLPRLSRLGHEADDPT